MKKVFLVLLAALLCCSMLLTVGCFDEQTPPDDEGKTPDGDDGKDEGGEPAPGLSFALEDGSSRYTVMRSDYVGSGNPITQSAVAIRDALEAKLGVTVPIGTDWEKNPDPEELSSRYEILVGETNRPESKPVQESLGEYTWTIRVVGKKIIIAGSNEKAVTLAAQEFIKTYINGDGVINESLSVDGSYTPDPTDIVLEDNSTGKTNPTIIQTK